MLSTYITAPSRWNTRDSQQSAQGCCNYQEASDCNDRQMCCTIESNGLFLCCETTQSPLNTLNDGVEQTVADILMCVCMWLICKTSDSVLLMAGAVLPGLRKPMKLHKEYHLKVQQTHNLDILRATTLKLYFGLLTRVANYRLKASCRLAKRDSSGMQHLMIMCHNILNWMKLQLIQSDEMCRAKSTQQQGLKELFRTKRVTLIQKWCLNLDYCDSRLLPCLIVSQITNHMQTRFQKAMLNAEIAFLKICAIHLDRICIDIAVLPTSPTPANISITSHVWFFAIWYVSCLCL